VCCAWHAIACVHVGADLLLSCVTHLDSWATLLLPCLAHLAGLLFVLGALLVCLVLGGCCVGLLLFWGVVLVCGLW